MDSLENVKARLQTICDLVVAGTFPKTGAAAAVQACKIWLEVHNSDLDRRHLKELEALVGKLEAENKRLRVELAKRGGLRVTA